MAGLPTGYQLLKAIRVEDSAMFRRYIEKRDAIRAKHSEPLVALDPPALTRQAHPYRAFIFLGGFFGELFLLKPSRVGSPTPKKIRCRKLVSSED